MQLSAYEHDLSVLFAREYNCETGRAGALFERHFGSAPKRTDKERRSCMVYIFNNPVEKKLVRRAQEDRWNFLAYAESDHPFSEPLVLRDASWEMRKALKQVKIEHDNNRHLNYGFLKRIYSKLDTKERAQMTDYIISLYNVIDYSYAISLFGSYENMLHAMHCSTGSEHDLNEIFTGKSDVYYSRISQYLKQRLNLKDIHQIFQLSEPQREELFFEVLKNMAVPGEQLAKYLRIRIGRE